MTYPPRFVWGAATAAFQIEGATTVDGRSESIWDRFAATPGNVLGGDTGEPACQHYFRYEEDLDLMRDLGMQGYRFSMAWPRIQPTGRGPVNQKGIDFYRKLVDGLLERGIRPFATLYHWDLPQALEDEEGGWVGREVVDRFVEYANIVFDAFGSDVTDWITMNEPWVQSFLGYGHGVKAPGVKDWHAAVRAAHHLLLAHGRAVESFREHGRAGRIGITLDLTPCYGEPAAAKRQDGYRNRWFLDPVLRGAYPQDMVDLYAAHGGVLDCVEDGDLEAISTPIDFMGVNYYHPTRVAPANDGSVLSVVEEPQPPVTSMGWEVRPESLVELLVRIASDYPRLPPLWITENGAAYDDILDSDGAVDDAGRLEYLKGHVEAVGQAIDRGVDLRGYFVWSFLDNFEWEYGYSKRFGVVHIDYLTQVRTPKRSALWYRDFIVDQTARDAPLTA